MINCSLIGTIFVSVAFASGAEKHPFEKSTIIYCCLIGIIFVSVAFTSAQAETPKEPVFVFVKLPADMNDATPRSLLKIEQARNMSGAFITTQVAKRSDVYVPIGPSSNTIPEELSQTSEPKVRPIFPTVPTHAPVTYGHRPSSRKNPSEDRLASRRISVISNLDAPFDGSTSRPIQSDDIELLFQRTLVGVCRSIFPDILQRNPHSTPFRHQNCSVLCVYGTSPVEIPEGGMCYQQRNFIGTPGHCRGGRCVISGKPFKFGFTVEGDSAFNPFSRPPLAPGFAPDVHAPRRTAPYSPRKR